MEYYFSQDRGTLTEEKRIITDLTVRTGSIVFVGNIPGVIPQWVEVSYLWACLCPSK